MPVAANAVVVVANTKTTIKIKLNNTLNFLLGFIILLLSKKRQLVNYKYILVHFLIKNKNKHSNKVSPPLFHYNIFITFIIIIGTFDEKIIFLRKYYYYKIINFSSILKINVFYYIWQTILEKLNILVISLKILYRIVSCCLSNSCVLLYRT